MGPVVKEGSVKLWLESDDFVLKELATACIEQDCIPTEREAIEILTFLLLACYRCGEAKLEKERFAFNRRANLFRTGLEQLGYGTKWFTRYTTMTRIPGLLYRVERRACAQVEYLTRESTEFKLNSKLKMFRFSIPK